MNNIEKVLLELSQPGEELEDETHLSDKNKIKGKVDFDPCLCKGKGKPCDSKNCIQKKKISEGYSKRKAESAIEKACTCDGGYSLHLADHEKKCPAYKMLKNNDFSSDDIDAAEYQYGDR